MYIDLTPIVGNKIPGNCLWEGAVVMCAEVRVGCWMPCAKGWPYHFGMMGPDDIRWEANIMDVSFTSKYW